MNSYCWTYFDWRINLFFFNQLCNKKLRENEGEEGQRRETERERTKNMSERDQGKREREKKWQNTELKGV